MSKLTKEKYPDQYVIVHNLMEKLNLTCPIYIYSNNQYTGRAGSRGIGFPSAVIEDFHKHPYVLRFFAAHELIHYKNKEYGIGQSVNFILAILIYPFGIKHPLRVLFANSLLREMRCNIDGASLAELTNDEIIKSQDEAQKKNTDPKRPKSYKLGYPDREMIKEYAQKYSQLTPDVAVEILEDYCKQLKIPNKQEFIKDRISNFFKSH